jgi:hypothetical protein
MLITKKNKNKKLMSQKRNKKRKEAKALALEVLHLHHLLHHRHLQNLRMIDEINVETESKETLVKKAEKLKDQNLRITKLKRIEKIQNMIPVINLDTYLGMIQNVIQEIYQEIIPMENQEIRTNKEITVKYQKEEVTIEVEVDNKSITVDDLMILYNLINHQVTAN